MDERRTCRDASSKFYWCGHLVTRLTGDPLGFWGRLFREAPGGVYGEEQLCAQLRGAPNGVASENAARLLLTASRDPIAAVLAADPGLAPSAKGTPPSPAYNQLAGLVLTTLVLRAFCKRDVAPLGAAGSHATLAVGVRDEARATAKISTIDLACPRPLAPRPPHVTPTR